MIKREAEGTVDYLQVGLRRYYFITADVKNADHWPFPCDSFPLFRGKSRNKKFKRGDRVKFIAVEDDIGFRALRVTKI